MFGHRYFAARHFAPRYFPDGGNVAPEPELEVTGGRSDGPRRRRKKSANRFSVFDHIDRSLAAIDSRMVRANEIAQRQEDVTPIIAEHFGIEISRISPIEYRTIHLNSLVPMIDEDWGTIRAHRLAEEERAILMMLQAIL